MHHPFRPSAFTHRSRAFRALLPLLVTSVLVAAASAQPSTRGYFRATPRANADWVRLEFMNTPVHDEAGGAILSDVARAELATLTAEQLSAGYSGPLRFTLVREAGSFTFDGKVRDGVADGMYTFAANPRYADALSLAGYERPSEAEQFRLALTGVDMKLVKQLRDLGYAQPTTADLVRMGTHGVDLDYVLSMASVADRLGTVAKLTKLRDHGVDLAFVSELERLGYTNLPADAMMALRDHGIDSVYITELADAGYIHLPPAKLVKAREQGVTGDFARAMQRAGFDRLTLDELGKLKDHDITAAFAEQIRRTASAGSVTADDLVRAKLRGVS
jgi:hypothetical protein